MQIKDKYSWLKHIDFMALDLIALFFSFSLSYYLKFHKWDIPTNEEWMRYLFIILIMNVVIEFFVNPHSGILRRSCYTEIVKSFRLAIINLLLSSLIFYSFKIGASYSREMTFVMYGIFFILSLVLRFLWKKLIISGKVVIKTTQRIPLFVIGKQSTIVKTIENITAGDFQLYEVKAVHLIDEVSSSVDIEGIGSIPTIGSEYMKYILENNIDEVLVAVAPEKVEEGILERLNANAVGINVVVESAIGFQPEDQYIQNFGVYKALSVGAFSFRPGQIVYLGIKRVIDIICGLIGVVVLFPVALIIKLANLISGDKAKIFYRQTRVGQHGRMIKIWKFRSMVSNADDVLQELLKDPKYKAEWEENQKFEMIPELRRLEK